MDLIFILASVCACWWLASLAFHIGSAIAALVRPLLHGRYPKRKDQPPVSVIVPVKDLTAGFEASFISLLTQDYPAFEILVAAAEKDSPALKFARTVAARYPQIPARFIARDPGAARNPKINNLATPIAEAQHDLIFVKDANIQLGAGQLGEVVEYLAGDTGLVVAAPIGIQPANFPAEIECAFMNGYVARLLLAASAIGWGFGIGAITLFDRRDFNRAGGIGNIADAIGEDHALSKTLGRIGKKTVITGRVVKQAIGARRIKDVWSRQLRWAVCRRIEEPLAFYAEPFTSALLTAMAGGIGAPVFNLQAMPVMAGTILIWIAVEISLTAAKGWPLSWRSPLATLCYLGMFPLLWLQALLTRRIFWGGTAIELRAK